ncbi:MAG: bifunctional metallophosphatase/5'-nucleotidase [Clostridiales bacterium]|nr:bifunctional metallophosphatase/5'-nucleotidase [Clostridiales bacterium]
MNKLSKRLGAMALVLTMTASYVPAVFAEDAGTQEPDYTGWDTIKVFETTDVHGYITDVSSYKEDTFEYRLAYFSKIVNDARNNDAYEDVLLLDTGDIYQGTPHSNLTYGAAMRAAYDQMDYDAVGLGNHEFDWDVKTYATDAKGTMAPYEIGSYKGDSDIPVLMSNLYYKDSGERVEFTQDYTIVDKGDYKVGIVGWADDYSADIKASQIAPYTIDDNREKLKELAEEVDKKADIVVILAHSDPKSIAEEMDPEVVDLVVGGHTHKNVNGTADNGIDYMQGNCYAYGYSTTEIKVNPETKDVEVTTPEFKDISPKGGDHSYLYYNNGNNTQLDPEVTKISQAAWDAVKGEMYEVLGTVDQSITRDFIDEANGTSSIAGNWLADMMLAATKDQNTVAAFANRGGIRANLEMAEGASSRDITVADIYTISPFGNRILTFAITGQQMAQQLERALIGLNPEIEIDSDAAYQASNLGDQFAGITATYKVVDGGIKVLSIMTDDGQIIDVNDTTKTYNVCVNEYCATLDGSVFKGMTPLVAMDEAPVDNLSTIAALREHRDTEGLNIELDTTVHTLTLQNKIQQWKDALGSYDKTSLTEADRTEIQNILDQVNYILASGDLATEEKTELQNVKAIAEGLLKTTDSKPEGEKPDTTPAPKPTTPPKRSPKTGDTASTMPWVVLVIAGGAGVAAVELSARKKQNRG